MIVLFNPRVTRPKNRRMPLAVMAIAAVIEGREEYTIVDGNVDPNPTATLLSLIEKHNVELLAVTVMPGPQMAAALEPCRTVRDRFPRVPIVWGGYFPSIYPDVALNADYVDYAVRGQGETTFLELLAAIRGGNTLDGIRGLSYKRADGSHAHNLERVMVGPDTFPVYPYHRLPMDKYLLPSFFGKRTAVHHASIGCPYQCSFCGVISAYGSREKFESPARTESTLRHLQEKYGADSVQFYDMNMFLREDHTRELAERMTPLKMRWWCEARADILSKYSDATLEALKRAGCTMIFIGAESGSDWVLKQMNKGITTDQTLNVAARFKKAGIIPEFSFVLGNPSDPERDASETLAFIRKIKILNPASEIIVYHYTPVPQRERMYGNIEFEFPTTPEEWATPKWQSFTMHLDMAAPWMSRKTKALIDNFELVISSRWPTVQDFRLTRTSRAILKLLSSWRYRLQFYSYPIELRMAHRWIEMRKPKFESL